MATKAQQSLNYMMRSLNMPISAIFDYYRTYAVSRIFHMFLYITGTDKHAKWNAAVTGAIRRECGQQVYVYGRAATAFAAAIQPLPSVLHAAHYTAEVFHSLPVDSNIEEMTDAVRKTEETAIKFTSVKFTQKSTRSEEEEEELDMTYDRGRDRTHMFTASPQAAALEPELHVYTDGSAVLERQKMAWGAIVRTGAPMVQLARRRNCGRVRPLTRTSSMLAELVAIANVLVRTASNVELTVHTDSKAAIEAITSYRECTSMRQRHRRRGWVILSMIDWMLRRRTAAFHMKHVKAHAGHVWNEEADRLANAGHTSSTSGVYYDVEPNCWYAYQMDRQVTTLRGSAGRVGVLIPGDVAKHVSITARNAALNELADKYGLSGEMLRRLLRVELKTMSRAAQAFVAALLSNILQVSQDAELTDRHEQMQAVLQHIGDGDCGNYSRLLFGVDKGDATRTLNWMQIKERIEKFACHFRKRDMIS
jgi:ribonuclease HI